MTKSSQELYIITNFPTFLTEEMVSVREKICQLSLNDLHDFFNISNVQGLPTISELFENKLNIFFKLFAFLYADDTVLVAESPEELQKTIDRFHFYCKRWNLKMNIDKSKILIFCKGRQTGELQF